MKKSRKEKLTVEGVAIKRPDCTVYCLMKPAKHSDLLGLVACKLKKTDTDKQKVRGELGFVLSDGSFASKDKAREVAEKSGQLSKTASKSNILRPEDLW